MTTTLRLDYSLSKDFRASEFWCPCAECEKNGIIGKMDEGFMEKLQAVRDGMGEALKITSGFRCIAHNATLDSSQPDSEHLYGHAADIAVSTAEDRIDLIDIALREGMIGFGIAKDYVHLDDGARERRAWTYYK